MNTQFYHRSRCFGLSFQAAFEWCFANPGRALGLIAGSFLLVACSTPQINTAAPLTVTIPEDLHFKWYPPLSGTGMEISISAGRYTRTADDGAIVYYESGTGLVSLVRAGHPAERAKGGIAYLKKKGRYFVWEFAPSYNVRFPLNGWSDELQDGPTVQIYLGPLPKELEHGLRFEL